MEIVIRLFFVFLLILFCQTYPCSVILAATSGASLISSQTKESIDRQANETIENKIYQQDQQSDSTESNDKGKEKLPALKTAPVKVAPKNVPFLVNKIDIQGATIPTNIELYKIITPVQGTLMTLADAKKVADEITDLYRSKGFITSRAYIPPQEIKNNTLIIKVLEGKLGKIDVKGNKHFRTHLLKREIGLKENGYFDYSALQKSLVYINQHPDRIASTILVPGQKSGTTDVVLNVKDRLPIHAGFSYDNYGSRYIEKNRYALTLEDNNLLGFDDRLFAKVQSSNNNYLRFGQLQYIVPVTETLNVGVYGVYSKLKLTKEFKDLESVGTAKIMGIFVDKAIIQDPGLEWRLNGGFDYKNIRNKDLGELISRDKLRVIKAGTELDLKDPFGRTIISPEIDVGIPKIFDGMKSKDPLASRLGSGGSFQIGDMYLYRLQPLPLSTSLLWKNSMQWSNENLPSPEQFEIGGADSVRGYGPAAYSGDSGIYSSLEWSLPFYFIPGTVAIPWSRDLKLKDTLHFVTFYDIGYAHLNSVVSGERQNTTLQSLGYGVRLNVHDNVTCRVEVGYPIGPKPQDHRSTHVWVETTIKY